MGFPLVEDNFHRDVHPLICQYVIPRIQADDKTLKIWDVASGTCKATLAGHRYLSLFPPLTGGET